MARRLLFVDDEPCLRATMSDILRQHSFEVTAAATVPEALTIIASQPFDVLLSDLNIGQPGDGFTVVSAMRRTQPNCATLIMTGYPDFETALQAIRNQVDDYIVKPASIPVLVETIERKLLACCASRPDLPNQRVANVIAENVETIVQRALVRLKEDPEMAALPLNDEQRTFPFAPLLLEAAEMLHSQPDQPLSARSLISAGMRGHIRRLQGYSAAQLVDSMGVLEETVYTVVDEKLLLLDISVLMGDVRRLHHCLNLQLRESVRAFLETAERCLQHSHSPRWSGWYCERCCWNLREPNGEVERKQLARCVQAQFEAHDCESFARAEWNVGHYVA